MFSREPKDGDIIIHTPAILVILCAGIWAIGFAIFALTQ